MEMASNIHNGMTLLLAMASGRIPCNSLTDKGM